MALMMMVSFAYHAMYNYVGPALAQQQSVLLATLTYTYILRMELLHVSLLVQLAFEVQVPTLAKRALPTVVPVLTHHQSVLLARLVSMDIL